jgi:hypothetical protein
MSLKTWKSEFYKVPANEVKSDIEALDHSILKWDGLSEVNLEKHRLYYDKDYGFIVGLDSDYFDGDGRLDIDSSNCALCQLHLSPTCENCPLYKALGNQKCDDTGMPYLEFLDDGNVLPMQAALEVAKREYLEGHKDDK